MSCNTNLVVVGGNLTRDPEMRYTQGGTAVCTLGLANNRKFNGSDGQANERVTFLSITVWEKQAEACAQHLKKGAPVLVEGELQLDTWQDQQGQKQSRVTIRAHRVQFLGRAPERDEQPPFDTGHNQPPAAGRPRY